MKSSRRSDPPGVGANGESPLLLHALTIRVGAKRQRHDRDPRGTSERVAGGLQGSG